MRKVLPIILLVALLLVSVLALVPANAAEPVVEKKVATVPAGYKDTLPADAVAIGNQDQLRNLGAGKYGYLTNDFTIDSTYIGTVNPNWLSGTTTLDGCGHTITFNPGIDVATSGATSTSLFSGTGGAINIKNLNIKGNVVDNNTDHTGILFRHGGNNQHTIENVVVDVNYRVLQAANGHGMLIGKSNGESFVFTNVHTYGKFIIDHAYTGAGYPGVAGYVGGTIGGAATVTNCSANTDIIINQSVAKISVGGFFADVTGQHTYTNVESTGDIEFKVAVEGDVGGCRFGVGGIVGVIGGNKDYTFTNVVNKGNITNKVISYGTGGLIGCVNDSARVTIRNSANYGNVSTLQSKWSGDHSGIAGFVGAHNAASNTVGSIKIYDSLNAGDIVVVAGTHEQQKDKMRGGFLGRAYGSKTLVFEGCVNTGDISGVWCNGWDSAGGILGGLATYNYNWSQNVEASITFTDCVNTGDISGAIYNGGIMGSAMQANSTGVTITIDGCANYGTINNGTGCSGGIAGKIGESSCCATLVVTDCYNAGKASSGIVNNIYMQKDTGGKDSNYIGTATAPVVANCVNEGTVNTAIVGTATGNALPGKVEIKNCVYDSGTVNTDVLTVTAPADAAAVRATVKAGICANTGLHDALELNTYLAATCEDNGHNAHYYCATCDTYWDEDKNVTTEAAVVIPNIHSTLTWNDEVPAGCTTTGTKGHYACATCGKNYDSSWAVIDDVTIPTLHSQLTWNDEVPAGCDATGTKGHYACAECGKNYDSSWAVIDDLTIPTLHSQLTWNNEVPADCDATGTKGHYACAECGKNYDTAWAVIDDITIPTLHSQLTWNDEVAPTCDTVGVKGHYACTTCGKNYDATWTEIDDLTISTLYASIKELEELTADINDAVTKLDVSTLAGKLDALEQAIIDAEANAKTHAEDKDAALKTELLGLIAAAKQEAITAAQTALDAAVENLEAADEALANNKADKSALENAINDLNAAIALAETTAKTYAKDYTDEEIGKLNTTLTQAITDAKNAAIKVANDNLETARQELNAAKEALEDADEALDNKKADKAALEAAINTLNDAIALAERTAKAYADTQDGILKTDLEGQIADAKTELYGAIDALEAAIRAELEALRAELNNAVDDLYELVGENLDVTADALSAALDKVDALIAETNAALQRADAENKQMLEDALAAAELTVTAVIEKLMADLENALADVNTAIENGDTVLDAKVEVLNAALENAQAALKIAAAEDKAALLTKIKKADEALADSIKALKKDLDDTKAALEARDVEIYNALAAKDNSLETFVIIVCVIASVAFAGCAAFVIYFFVSKKPQAPAKKKK